MILILVAMSMLAGSGCDAGRDGEKVVASNKKHRVAVLLASDMYLPLSGEGLKEGMADLGYREGENIAYEVYNAAGDLGQLKALARQIVSSRPDIICPSIVNAIDAVRETGTALPVVFLESMYPVEFGVVESLVRPGANYTGVSNMTGPMSGKRLELLAKVNPHIKRVAVICNPANTVAMLSLEA